MRFASIGSGSEGNGLIVEAGITRVLIDCGFGVRQRARVLCDPRQHRVGVGAGKDLAGDLVQRVQPTLACAHLFIQRGVGDRRSGLCGQDDEGDLVLGAELAGTALLGQVDVAVDLAHRQHRRSEE